MKKQLAKKYWIYILVLLIGVIFLIKPIKMTMENYQLANSGHVTNAVIVGKKWESASYRNDDGYYYNFTVNGEVYSGHTFDGDKRPFDTVKILYLSNRPNVNRPYDFIERNYLR
jgi:hypothetical protein